MNESLGGWLSNYDSVTLEQSGGTGRENVINDQKQQIGWGSQIRSYVLHPYKLIKDLRTNHESSNINDILDGEIDNFLEKSLSL